MVVAIRAEMVVAIRVEMVAPLPRAAAMALGIGTARITPLAGTQTLRCLIATARAIFTSRGVEAATCGMGLLVLPTHCMAAPTPTANAMHVRAAKM
jgi:hypothetical protein